MNYSEIKWHNEILPVISKEVFNDLFKVITLTDFYLAGGTGLALQLGHRISQDFDFFSNLLFNEEILLQKMKNLNEFTILSRDEHTIHITFRGIKISFLGYTYPLLFQAKEFRLSSDMSISVDEERDIACMKISAIGGRGIKRDFVDLYFVIKNYSFPYIIELFKKKFSLTPYNNIHILKALTYFTDAETEPMPHLLLPVSWDEIKRFFISEVPNLL